MLCTLTALVISEIKFNQWEETFISLIAKRNNPPINELSSKVSDIKIINIMQSAMHKISKIKYRLK